MEKTYFSLKFKIIGLLTLIVSFPIIYFVYSLINAESVDKKNTAFNNQMSETRFVKEKLSNNIETTFNILRTIASIQITDKTESDYTNMVDGIVSNQNFLKLESITVNEVPLIKDLNFKNIYSSSKNNDYNDYSKKIIISNFDKIIKKRTFFIDSLFLNNIKYLSINLIDLNYDNKYHTKVIVYSALMNMNNFNSSFSYLIQISNENDSIIYSSLASDYNKDSSKINNFNSLLEKSKKSKIDNMTIEINQNDKKYLASISKMPLYGLSIFVSQPIDQVLAHLYQMIQKVIILGIISIFMVFIIASIFTNHVIIKPMDVLTDATKDISKGVFDINITKIKSNDEFKKMGHEIMSLLNLKMEKLKLENEINIASTIQKTFFPQRYINEKYYNISSYYKAANSCGGDLWYHFIDEVNQESYFVIADATGHGLNSALLTVSIRSCFSTIEELLKQKSKITLLEMINLLNHAIFDCSKGEINVTLFLMKYSHNDNTIQYVNAGHNHPWLFLTDDNCKIKSMQGIGRQLGESKNIDLDNYSVKTLSLNGNEKLFLYTDGIIEEENKNKEPFAKKRVKDMLLSNYNNKPLVFLMKHFVNFTKKDTYSDDITLVWVEFNNIKNETKRVA